MVLTATLHWKMSDDTLMADGKPATHDEINDDNDADGANDSIANKIDSAQLLSLREEELDKEWIFETARPSLRMLIIVQIP